MNTIVLAKAQACAASARNGQQSPCLTRGAPITRARRRQIDTRAIVVHPRYQALPRPAQLYYCELLAAAQGTRVDSETAARLLRKRGGDLSLIDALCDAGLLDLDPPGGLWICTPATVEDCDVFDPSGAR